MYMLRRFSFKTEQKQVMQISDCPKEEILSNYLFTEGTVECAIYIYTYIFIFMRACIFTYK